MDIWAWVWDMQDKLREEGHASLADAIFKLPNDTVNGNHQEIDQYIDGLVAEARQSGFTWVELFFRHWYMQSKILHRGEPKEAIKEAVSLLEFAHQEENRDCPQSICTVQDLASCYGQFDGPGYAEQRIAVATEGLNKINPDWPCYKCISAEYAEALCDAKRYDECLEFLDKIDNDYIENGEETDTSDLMVVRIHVLVRQGKLDKAKKYGKKLSAWGKGSNFEIDKATLRALVDAHDKQFQKALDGLPALERIIKEDASQLEYWVETMCLVIKGLKTQQTTEHIEQLLNVANIMHQRGTYRQAFDSYKKIIDLFDIFPGVIKPAEILDTMKQIKDKLHQDMGASETLQTLETAHFNQ